MKKLILLLSLAALNLSAQPSSNYFAIVSVKDISKQEFYAGSAISLSSTNAACPWVSALSGYIYPSNFATYTTWAFPPRIITTTNSILSFHLLTTNSATVLAGSYRIRLYTNNVVVPSYDSGDTTWVSSLPSYNTNITIFHITNNFPTNLLSYSTNYSTNLSVISTNVISNIIRTNLTEATVSVLIGPINTNTSWYTTWLAGGKIEFQ